MALTRSWRSRTEDIAVAMMFGDAARLAVGLGLFVHARAPIAIPAFRCTEPMGPMAAQDIGLLTQGWGYRW